MRMDERTDMTKLTVAFRNFANAPTNTKSCLKTAKRKKERKKEKPDIIFMSWIILQSVSQPMHIKRHNTYYLD
jgi:hypothetical protein